MSIIRNKAAFLGEIKHAPIKQEATFKKRVLDTTWMLHTEITWHTPVWSGEALASYVWSAGSPSGEGPREPIDTGPPGHTNSMSIGEEPRRNANQQEADESYEKLNFSNPYQYFYLNNNAPHIGGLEYGLLPEDPLRQRSPNGMFGLALALVEAKLGT